MQEPRLIANRWQCPDGTVLQSLHRYDYVSHKDVLTGEECFVDGGIFGVLRTSGNLKDLCVYSNDPHEVKREVFYWKTYGKNGDKPGEWICLKDIGIGHMNAILSTQTRLSEEVRSLFIDEIKFRAIKTLKELYKYCDSSPSGIVKWVKKYQEYQPRGAIRYNKGTPESWVMNLGGKQEMVHRVIWQIVNGPIPDGMVIDHMDGNPLNNSIGNLRVVSNAQNSRNTKMYSSNISGKSGVCFRSMKSGDFWRATWVEDNIRKEKSFSLKKYPNAHELACEYRDRMIRYLNEKGCDYTERHGKLQTMVAPEIMNLFLNDLAYRKELNAQHANEDC